MENLSISILGLSSQPLKKQTENLLNLTKLTSGGCFMNLTDKSKLEMVNQNDETTKFDKLIQQFKSSLSVYPSE